MPTFPSTSPQHKGPPEPADSPTLKEQQQQVDRVCRSTAFTNSEVLRNMLSYLFRASADHPGRPAKEYELGVAVLGRNEGFDPRLDSSVRVHCARLRTRLMEYYLGEGASDPVELTIPKGAYNLVARYREVPRRPEIQTTVLPARRASTARRPLLWAPWAVSVAAVATAIWFWSLLPPSVSGELKHFWSTFDSRPDETLAVFSNPRFVGSVSNGGLLYEPPNSQVPLNEINDRYTGIGEAMSLQQLTRLFERLRLPLRAKRSGLLTWDEARSRNFIFIGAPEVNRPQMELPKLEQFAFKPADDEPQSGRGGIINLQPQAGEQQYYLNSGPPYTHDYAVIALVPGLNAGRRALILAGRTTYGTQGAVEFLLDPRSTSGLLSKLDAQRSRLPFFEALLRVKVSGGVPVQPELVILRRR